MINKIVKDIVPKITEFPDNPFEKLDKLPKFITYLIFRLNMKKMRKMMGGKSKDISSRKILLSEEIIKGYEKDVKVQIFKPEEDEKRPLLMFYHGGGFFGGSLWAVENFCRLVADKTNSVVVSVDYSLCPEHKFPAAVEDSYNAILWCIKNKSKLNIDTDKIIVSGDSAGGTLSAVMTLLAKNRKEFKIVKQILLYPATNFNKGVVEKSATSIALMKLYMKKYKESNNPYVSPFLYKDHSNLPEALICCGEYDFLLEDTLLYADKLDKANVPVTHITYKNEFHAFIDDTGVNENAKDLVCEIAKFLNK
jgi:acetyl esterase/lipase